MSDIVQELRAAASVRIFTPSTFKQARATMSAAANEIERLRGLYCRHGYQVEVIAGKPQSICDHCADER